MALNFGEWVVKVAVNGVKSGSFGREWASLQLADYYARNKITEVDLMRFDEGMDEYEKQKELALREMVQEINEYNGGT